MVIGKWDIIYNRVRSEIYGKHLFFIILSNSIQLDMCIKFLCDIKYLVAELEITDNIYRLNCSEMHVMEILW